jgi:hypothetical protein
MGKTKMTFEEAVTAKETKFGELKEAKAALIEFKKENKLKGDAEPDDVKLTKKFGKLKDAVDSAQEDFDAAKVTVKELKPAKERQVKYDYPEGISAQDKKKFRAAARAAAKKEEKGEKKSKKDDKVKDQEEKKTDKKKKRKDDDD